jgi:hypothetical protein
MHQCNTHTQPGREDLFAPVGGDRIVKGWTLSFWRGKRAGAIADFKQQLHISPDESCRLR